MNDIIHIIKKLYETYLDKKIILIFDSRDNFTLN